MHMQCTFRCQPVNNAYLQWIILQLCSDSHAYLYDIIALWQMFMCALYINGIGILINIWWVTDMSMNNILAAYNVSQTYYANLICMVASW